jgi:carbonic anhydrase
MTTINISSTNVYGNCDLKCSYNFKYSESNTVAKNNDNFISLTYDKGTTTPVVYNNNNYYVSKINVYSQSLHKFDNNYTNAEFVIEHVPEKGGDMLYVCIPIISSTNSSDASNVLTGIIESVATNAPRKNESTNINISNFNLNTIVPKKPFYAYNGTQGLVGNVIVFGINYAIPLNSNILTKLSKIIKPFPITVTGGTLFLNNKGPNNTNVKEGIYISCQPTGSSNEEVEVVSNKSQVDFDLSSMLNNPTTVLILQIFIGIILSVIIFYMLNFSYKYFILGNKIQFRKNT